MSGYIIGGMILFFIGLITYRTVSFTKRKEHQVKHQLIDKVNGITAVEKLSQAIRLKTVSNSDESLTDWNEFRLFHCVLEDMFPLVHQHMEKEIINEHSLLYNWKGKSQDKKPVLVTAHMDVVPIQEGTEENWAYPPFSGYNDGEYIWGRGALDMKVHLISAFEAAELSLAKGFIPDRDIYFAFGHDEETGGIAGAYNIAKHLKDKGISFDFLVDEGGAVTKGIIDDIEKPIAIVGVGEKGYANIKISVAGNGGHSSMPPKHTALGTLSKVIQNLEKHQCRMRLIEPIQEFLMKIGPEMSLVNRVILSNLWLFKPMFMKVFSKSGSGNALLRTTTAVTMSEGSIAPNVLPEKASIICNFRIRPGETSSDLLEHIRRVNEGIDLDIEVLRLAEPSMISSSKTEGFTTIEKVLKSLYPTALVSPYIVLAGTDARKYEDVCESIYRITPYLLDKGELDRIHNTNERVSIINVKNCVNFFYRLYREV